MKDLKEEPTRLGFDEAVSATEEEIKNQLKSAPAELKRLTGHLSHALGKNIRARSLLACAIQGDGQVDVDAVKIAAAIELIHLATLVHDDIIDNALKRRGIEALHKKFGEKPAVICGDFLFCLAFQLAATIKETEERKERIDRTLPTYLTEICLGELRQNQNNQNYALTEREYFKIISGKTAALFEAAFHAGFLLSEEPDSEKNGYKEIGKNIGIIFQLADDCIDYEATQKVAKKTILNDFRAGVVTLPLIYSIKKDTGLRDKIVKGIDPKELRKAVTAAGGLSYTHLKISNYYNKTKSLIDALDTRLDKKGLLVSLLEKAAGI